MQFDKAVIKVYFILLEQLDCEVVKLQKHAQLCSKPVLIHHHFIVTSSVDKLLPNNQTTSLFLAESFRLHSLFLDSLFKHSLGTAGQHD